jgi:hypothetical protein
LQEYISKLEIAAINVGVSHAAACDNSSLAFELPGRKLNIHQFKLLDVRMQAAEQESMNLRGFLYNTESRSLSAKSHSNSRKF